MSTEEHRAWIAGATGYTGRALVSELTARGVTTHAHIRPGSTSLPGARDDFERAGAEVVVAPWEPAALGPALARANPTHVFFVVGTTRERLKREEDAESYEAVDYALADRLLEAARLLDEPPVFVYLSAQGTSARSRSAYYRARWHAEQAVRQSGLPFVIARPGFISGPDRREVRRAERLGSVVASGLARGLGAFGARRWQRLIAPRDASQMARQLIAAALDPATHHQTLEAADLWSLEN